MRRPLLLLPIVISLLLPACGDGDSDEFEYAAMGASDALGVGATPLTNGYVFRIEDALEQCRPEGASLTNLGIPAATIREIEDVELPAAVDTEPNLVTLWTGANDIIDGEEVEDFESRLNEILTELQLETEAFIVIGNIPDLTRLPRFQQSPDPHVTAGRIAAFNQAISRQAESHNIPVADVAGLPLSGAEVTAADGFHPNDQGYQVIAQAFLDIIRPAVCPPGSD